MDDQNSIEVITNSNAFKNFLTFVSSFIKILKFIYFLFNIFFIFSLGGIQYIFDRNYKNLIMNITNNLANSNILYIKIFQAFAFDNKFIDETINQEIVKFTNSTPYSDDEIDWNTFYSITKKYGLNSENACPINSGMISIVFKLPLITQDNSDKFLILKMKRNNIDKKLDESIENLRFILYFISFMPFLNKFKIHLLFDKNINLLKEQLDFKKEMQNTIESKKICKTSNFIEIPSIYEEITNCFPNAILMEYINGKNIDDIAQNDRFDFAKLILKYGIISIINQGIFHGDLHCGNILFIKNDENNDLPKYKIGVIDFGIVVRINSENRNGFFNFLSKLYNSESSELSKIVFDVLLEPKETINNLEIEDKKKILSVINELIYPFTENSKFFDINLFFDCITTANDAFTSEKYEKYNIHLNDEFIKMQLGLLMSYGVCSSIYKGYNRCMAREAFNELFHLDIIEDLFEDIESECESECECESESKSESECESECESESKSKSD